MRKIVWVLLFFTAFPLAQNASMPFAFKFSGDIPIQISEKTLSYPWTGGFNACHIASFDLDNDGVLDKIVYDKIGGRISPFLHKTNTNQYAPEYRAYIPPLLSWVQAYDYNADGLLDLFTYNGMGGISVYRNVSKVGNSISFVLQTSAIPTQMFSQKTAVYCTQVDYPAFLDIDGDGDMDILNFWIPSTGDFLLYYKNLSKEKYNMSDSLIFEVADWSWGCFAESNESNVIFLDTCADIKAFSSKNTSKHTGSTLFPLKNGAVFDLLLGDIDYPALVHLKNKGTSQNAYIGSYEERFPPKNPIELWSFPLISKWSENGIDYALASPFSADPLSGQGIQSLWKYQMKPREDSVPDFVLIEKDFLQNKTLDFGNGAHPCLADINGDGLMDMVVGNYNSGDTGSFARLYYFENTGSQNNPIFTLISDDFYSLSNLFLLALTPTFGDLNQDGELEMILGSESGKLYYFERGVLKDTLPFSGGAFSAPQLFDLDKDGLLDLLIGQKRKVWIGENKNITKGSISYYRNIGSSANASFEFITDSLGGMDMIDRNFSNFAYTTPCFYRNVEDETFLFCGNENGQVYIYDQIDGNIDGRFRYRSDLNFMQVGIFSSPSLFDLNADGFVDIIIGNQAGGLEYFKGEDSRFSNDKFLKKREPSYKIYPNPVRDYLYVEPVDAKTVYSLYDMQNRLCMQTFELPIELRSLKKGIYLLKMENSQGSFVYKIIKQ